MPDRAWTSPPSLCRELLMNFSLAEITARPNGGFLARAEHDYETNTIGRQRTVRRHCDSYRDRFLLGRIDRTIFILGVRFRSDRLYPERQRLRSSGILLYRRFHPHRTLRSAQSGKPGQLRDLDDFEDDTTDGRAPHDGNITLTPATTVAHTGSYSLEVSGRTASYQRRLPNYLRCKAIATAITSARLSL